jgi:hypothetical protein
MLKQKIILFLILLVFLFGRVLGDVIQRTYNLPNKQSITFNVPSNWRDDIQSPSPNLPPTIHFTASSLEGENFDILITVLWKAPKANLDFATLIETKAVVQQSLDHIASDVVEKNVQLKSIGNPIMGYYFSVTDKAPKPGEYEYLSQGAVRKDNIECVFTILTHTSDSIVVVQALTMLSDMIYSGK